LIDPPATAGGTDKLIDPSATAGGTDKLIDPPATAGGTDKQTIRRLRRFRRLLSDLPNRRHL